MAILIHKTSSIQVTSQSHDDEGRWAEATVIIDGETVVILNIYVPNVSDISFWDKISQRIHSYEMEYFIVAGDFNLPLDHRRDRLSKCGFVEMRRTTAYGH